MSGIFEFCDKCALSAPPWPSLSWIFLPFLQASLNSVWRVFLLAEFSHLHYITSTHDNKAVLPAAIKCFWTVKSARNVLLCYRTIYIYIYKHKMKA